MEICIKWSICRTCTSDSSSQLQSIFDDTKIADQLLEYAGLVVKPKDGLPDQICEECVYSLQLAHTFLTNCKRADTNLKNAVRRTMSPKKCFPAAVCLDADIKNPKQIKAETDEIQARNQIIAEKQQQKILNTHLQNSLFLSDQEELVSEEEEDSTSYLDNPELVSANQSSEDSSSSEHGTNNEDLKLESKCEQIIENENENNELITVVADEVSHDDDNDEKKDVINAAATDTKATSAVAASSFDVDITACAPSRFQNFDCTVCGNAFRNAQHLKSHMRTHRNERSYECELCCKRFNAACNLTTHMRTHTGEKPYPCVHCGRRFADRSTHRKHERMHTNERPYACTICGKTFSLSTTLKAHALSHSKEKPHKCVTCNKGFRLPHQLKAHEKTHVHRYEVDFLAYK